MALSAATMITKAEAMRASASFSSAFNGFPSQLRAPATVQGAFFRSRNLICRADNIGLNEVKKAIDSTKVPITKKDVLRNQESYSEQHSVAGTKPVEGSPLPRAEVDRRPEIGNTDLGSIMAFDGPGPETINGRLAMLGCTWALIAELTTGQSVIDQINYPGSPGLFWLLASVNVLVVATLVPLFNGESPDSRKNGPFTAQAERWNGRVAMIGFAGILAYEFATKTPVFHF